MAWRSTHPSLLCRIAWIAMLLPFVALSALPSGVMPGRSDAGTLTLVLCTPDGPREMSVNLGGDHPDAAQHGCPWALAHMALVLPEAMQTLRPALVLPRDRIGVPPTDLLPAVLPGPRTARAPPAFA